MDDTAKTADSDLTIRPVGPGDMPRLQEIRRAAFQPVFASFREIVGEPIFASALSDSDRDQAASLDALCRGEGGAVVLAAVLRSDVVGFAGYTIRTDGRVGEIGLNAVHPDHAGRGIGTRLYGFVLERMKERGATAATVSTGGDPSHAPPRRAYEKAGFAAPLPPVTLHRRL